MAQKTWIEMLAPNKNEVLKVETVSQYTIGKVTHIHVRYHYFDRTEMKEILVPEWDELFNGPIYNHMNAKSPIWRGHK